jgi:cofilin
MLANHSFHQASSGVSVAPECISAFNDLKLKKELKYIIYKISDDWKEIVVEETSTDGDYSTFRQKLLDAKSKDKKGKEGIGGRYAVFDIEYDLDSGEGKRNKITFISWCPDDAPQYVSPFCDRRKMNEMLTEE